MRIINNKKLNKRLDDRGAAIVTVIVVCAFITIIATTMLYISARNFQTKQVDYQNKISFYQAEEALDTLKSLLVEDVNDAFKYAYADTMANVVDHKGTPNVSNYYSKSYTEKLSSVWAARSGLSTSQLLVASDATKAQVTAAVKTYMTNKLITEPGLTGTTQAVEIQSMIDCIQEVSNFYIPPAKDKFVMVGVKSAFTTGNGYSTYIYTDIGLELPQLYISGMEVGIDPSSPDNPANYAGHEVNVADCVKYMNWHRYDD